MKAEIIAIGSELLTPQRVDTNSLFITERLNELGIEVLLKTIVGDDRGALSALTSKSPTLWDLIVMTGSLGTTDDDVTSGAVAAALAISLLLEDNIGQSILPRISAGCLAMT